MCLAWQIFYQLEVESFNQSFHALEIEKSLSLLFFCSIVIIWVGRSTFISLELIDLLKMSVFQDVALFNESYCKRLVGSSGDCCQISLEQYKYYIKDFLISLRCFDDQNYLWVQNLRKLTVNKNQNILFNAFEFLKLDSKFSFFC